jgi:hypothetical protein
MDWSRLRAWAIVIAGITASIWLVTALAARGSDLALLYVDVRALNLTSYGGPRIEPAPLSLRVVEDARRDAILYDSPSPSRGEGQGGGAAATEPSAAPTASRSASPSSSPSPSPSPTLIPLPAPTILPTLLATPTPTPTPSPSPSIVPSIVPSILPTPVASILPRL